ncbi:hypothetical protein MNJPNG_11350 [Cupriavidus oxalaticus]
MDASGRALQQAALNGKSRRLLGHFDTEAEAIAAIKQAVLLEAKWQPRKAGCRPRKNLCGILAISEKCLYNLGFRRSALR